MKNNNNFYSPNFFEKLFDDQPKQFIEKNPLKKYSLEELKLSVARDLESLFNTRRTKINNIDDYTHIHSSILNFGIMDFVGLSSANPMDCDFICKEIAKTVESFDTRLKHVNVKMDFNGVNVNALSFSIEALMVVYPMQEYVSFDAVLKPSSQNYSVTTNIR